MHLTRTTLGFLIAVLFPLVAVPQAETGIVDIEREIYVEQTVPGQTRWVNAYYVGPGLEREEIHTFMAKSDTPEQPKRRRSRDNGRTWSKFEALPDVVTHDTGARVYWGIGPQIYDPASRSLVSVWLRQTKTSVYFNQSFVRLSRDGGRAWSEPEQLRYESGPTFDSAEPLNPEWLDRNQSYFGSNIIRHSNDTLIHAGTSANVPYENKTGKSYHPWFPADAKNIGSLCFIGTWNAVARTYDWEGGERVWVPFEVSSRGLMEPEVVELKDGRVLVVWRGSDTPVTAGRKWYSVSDDGGQTLSPVQEWKYDDGSSFYSPSSLHRFHRHSTNGKLYWVGNICPDPPKANRPRFPLVIAEVDEYTAALKRDTVTVIDTKEPEDHSSIQLSNFCVLEDRENHTVEIYMTRLVTPNSNAWGGHAYKYTLTFR